MAKFDSAEVRTQATW